MKQLKWEQSASCMRGAGRAVPIFIALAMLSASALGHPGDELGRPVLFEPGTVSTGFDDSHPTISPDGRTLYFLRNSPDFAHWTVLQANRSNGRWTNFEVAPFSGEWDDGDIFITSNGQLLLFISNRPAPGRAAERRDTDIWMMRKTTQGWGEPVHVPELSSEGDEWYPTMTKSGTVYFGSDRKGTIGASDIWTARFDGTHFSKPENVGAPVNTPWQEIEPLIDPDERYMIFSARREGQGRGAYDLFISYRCSRKWTDPEALPGEINSAGWDFSPRFSPDGREFLFTSNRSTFKRGARINAKELERLLSSSGNGLRDIYRISSSSLAIEPPCKDNPNG